MQSAPYFDPGLKPIREPVGAPRCTPRAEKLVAKEVPQAAAAACTREGEEGNHRLMTSA